MGSDEATGYESSSVGKEWSSDLLTLMGHAGEGDLMSSMLFPQRKLQVRQHYFREES